MTALRSEIRREQRLHCYLNCSFAQVVGASALSREIRGLVIRQLKRARVTTPGKIHPASFAALSTMHKLSQLTEASLGPRSRESHTTFAWEVIVRPAGGFRKQF